MVSSKKGYIFALANQAEIAQLVEHNLAKVGVASSSLVFRSTNLNPIISDFFLVFWALVVELVDTQDLKSCEHCVRTGSSPVRSTKKKSLIKIDEAFLFIQLLQITAYLVLSQNPCTLSKIQPNPFQDNALR